MENPQHNIKGMKNVKIKQGQKQKKDKKGVWNTFTENS